MHWNRSEAIVASFTERVRPASHAAWNAAAPRRERSARLIWSRASCVCGRNGTPIRFLVDTGARVVGNDTLTFEFRPPLAFPPDVPAFQVFPVHMLLIPQNGVYIIENYWLDEIAAAAEYEFLLVVPPIKVRGGTGSALRSFALVP